ncbi:MAG: tetratricopeptide repeat protein [Dyadobacter sp.]|uniref:tetratricopeptide repeat protein n=1 Tax=Dyadobacter sp. TaxID=1914288 RepID=UPI001AFE3EF6|nr:tetratricopeptide repeat protein [Dyadobacter sp.]MBO9611079.1 tetratricopeptide repeat protein [Dyadobacter sp.]
MKQLISIVALVMLTFAPLFAQTSDNAEIQRMYDEDQSARKVANIDWTILNKADSLRRRRVDELLDSNKVLTGQDFYRSAMIFQHGTDTLASAKAVALMRHALDLDSTVKKWLLAAAIDRHLMRKGLPQIYGTQYVMMGQNGKWQRYQIDSTKVTDQERRAYHVETLAEQLVKERRMNLRPISQYHDIHQSTDETAAFIRAEAQKGAASLYDVSETAINSFGYKLMANPSEAVKIFKLNTELYPNGFNTFDSYGECLMKLDRKKEAIAAYQKSLALNPQNTNARTVLTTLQAR